MIKKTIKISILLNKPKPEDECEDKDDEDYYDDDPIDDYHPDLFE